MLARSNRITKPADFRNTLGSGVRVRSQCISVHAVTGQTNPVDSQPKIGFVVGRACGSAVVRNRIKRRLKAVSRNLIPSLQPGVSVVVRAFPAASNADFATLESELTNNVAMIIQKLGRKSLAKSDKSGD